MSDRLETLETAVRIQGKQITALHNTLARLMGMLLVAVPEARNKMRSVLADMTSDLGIGDTQADTDE